MNLTLSLISSYISSFSTVITFSYYYLYLSIVSDALLSLGVLPKGLATAEESHK